MTAIITIAEMVSMPGRMTYTLKSGRTIIKGHDATSDDDEEGWRKMPSPKYAFEPSERDDRRREKLPPDALLIEDWIRAEYKFPFLDDPLDVVSYLQIAEDGDPAAIAGNKCAIGEIDFKEARVGDWWVSDGELGVIARIENGKVVEVRS